MATKKKTVKTTDKKEKQLEKMVENLENKIEQIEKIEEVKKNIKDKKQAIKEDLQNQLISQNKFGKQFEDMIDDYLYFFELKESLQRDINTNGLRYKTTTGNGFTSNKPNESYERLLKANDQMLKILKDLELKAPEEAGDDEDDLC